MADYTQNSVLRLYDLVGAGLVVGLFLLTVSFFWLNWLLLFSAFAEVAAMFIFSVWAAKQKRKLKAAGKWRKLTLKESIDLHEWRFDEE